MTKSLSSRNLLRSAALIIGLAFFVAGCGSSGGGGSAPASIGSTLPVSFSMSGQVQKGPLIFGSSIFASELDANLKPNGKTFIDQTNDDLGNFTISSNVGSNLIELLGVGYYMDELTGGLSTSPITLRAVADLTVHPTPIINVLTTLQEPRLKTLILQGQTYQAAVQQSQSETLAAFGVDVAKISSFSSLSAMSIIGTTDQDSVLLAISAVLSKMATNSAALNGSSQAAELTFYLSRIASDISNAGALTNSSIIAAKTVAATQLNLAAIRSNVETYYANRGVVIVAPRFEEWVDTNASGILPRRLVPVAGLLFTDTTSVEPKQLVTSNAITVSGLGTGIAAPVTVIADTTIIKNNTAVSGVVTTAVDGDTIAMRITSMGYGMTRSSTISVGSSTAVWRVTSKPLGGTISGLISAGLVLQNNGGDNVTIPAGNATFNFNATVANGADYSVTVLTQPTPPLQDCTVTNGTGTVGAAVSSVSVVCSATELAYVTISSPSFISAYSINAATGVMTSIGTFPTSAQSSLFITVHPNGKFVYASSNGRFNPSPNLTVPPDITAYSINAATGALTRIGSIVTGGVAQTVVVEPTGRYAYVVTSTPSNAISGYSINATTGALTSIGTFATGTTPFGIAVDATGKFAYVTNIDTNDITSYRIDATTGALTSIGTTPVAGTGPTGIVVDPTTKFVYVAKFASSDVSAFSINATTGALTSIGTIPTGTNPRSIAVDPTGKFVYTANEFSDNVSAFRIDSTTGALTSIGTIAAGVHPYTVVVDPTGNFAYVTNNGEGSFIAAYSINATTGALTSIRGSSSGTGFAGIAITRGP